MTAWPLQLTFKLIAIAPQISVTDARGTLLYYVRQKAFRIREKVTVYAEREQRTVLFTIGADRIIDWSARYDIARADGTPVGAVKRRGMRSLWRAHYDILRGEQPVMAIHEESAWTKVVDGLLGEIPVLGALTGYVFHPAYLVARPGGPTALRVAKQPAFFEGRYEITNPSALDEADEELALMSVLMMVLLERTRG